MKPLSQNRRIVCNALATYGRSVLAMLLGLFSTRWVYLSLGEMDFGLYGVVGSIIVFITFFNGVLASSVTRFYAYAIGQRRKLGDNEADLLLNGWFNTALSIHTLIPLLLIGCGYPLGCFAIEYWLTIPAERIVACLWVFRIALVTAFVSMVSIPFVSLYTAYQDIVELSVFGMIQTILGFIFAWILLAANGDRLVTYALFMMVVQAGIPILQILRARQKYPACRLHLGDWIKWTKEKVALFKFASFQLFGNCGTLMRHQACTLLTNKYFGPRINAAYGISGQVLSQAGSLSAALMTAFVPAITTAEGSGNREQMKRYAERLSCFGTFLLLLFLIPLGLEIREVLRLWLKSPPEWASVFCLVSFAEIILNKMTAGQQLAIMAQGNIGRYQLAVGGCLIVAFPVAWVLIAWGCGPLSMAFALLFTTLLASLMRVYFGWRQVAIRPVDWLRHIVFPVVVTCLVTGIIGIIPQILLPPSFQRVCVTTCVTLLVSFGCGWCLIFTAQDRAKVIQLLKKGRTK